MSTNTSNSPSQSNNNEKTLIIIVAVMIIIFFVVVGLMMMLLVGLSIFSYNRTIATTEKTCIYDGVTYFNREGIKTFDQCNLCSCDNGQIACTAIACNSSSSRSIESSSSSISSAPATASTTPTTKTYYGTGFYNYSIQAPSDSYVCIGYTATGGDDYGCFPEGIYLKNMTEFPYGISFEQTALGNTTLAELVKTFGYKGYKTSDLNIPNAKNQIMITGKETRKFYDRNNKEISKEVNYVKYLFTYNGFVYMPKIYTDLKNTNLTTYKNILKTWSFDGFYAKYYGDAGEAISKEYTNYGFFKSCNESNSNCSYFLVSKTKLTKINAVTGVSYYLHGKYETVGAAAGSTYLKFDDNVEIVDLEK